MSGIKIHPEGDICQDIERLSRQKTKQNVNLMVWVKSVDDYRH